MKNRMHHSTCNVFRQTIAISICLMAGANIGLHNPEKSLAQTSEIPMTPITTVEDFYVVDKWGQQIISQYYNILYPFDEGEYRYLGMPLGNGYKHPVCRESYYRMCFYEIDWIPAYAINGINKAQSKSDEWNTFFGLQVIKKGIETKQQYADFTLKVDKNGLYSLKIIGIDDRLNNIKNLNLNAIVLKREVNFTDIDDSFNTTILKQIAYRYPMDILGEKFQIKNKQIAEKHLNLGIKDNEKAMCGLVAFLQDMDTGEMVAASYTDLTSDTPAFFNIDHLPNCTVDNIEKVKKFTSLSEIRTQFTNKKEYQEQIGLQQKVISVTNAKDLRHLILELDYTEHEAQVYDVLGAALCEELQDKAILTYDPQEHCVIVTFSESLNGNHDIFNFFIKINTNTQNGIKLRKEYDEKDLLIYSTNFKFKNFTAEDYDFNTIKYVLNEQKSYHPVRMVTTNNPLDFNNDTWINEEDIQEFLPKYGYLDTDPEYLEIFDIYPPSRVIDGEDKEKGDGRIDVQDLYLLVRTVSEQEELAEKIKAVNPDFIYPTVDESIKDRVLTQICTLLSTLELSENNELNIQTISTHLGSIYPIQGNSITIIEHPKSFFDRVKDFFRTKKLVLRH